MLLKLCTFLKKFNRLTIFKNSKNNGFQKLKLTELNWFKKLLNNTDFEF